MALLSCEGSVLASGIGSTFVDGSGPVIDSVCLENGLGGLMVEVGGGEYPEDVSWTLTFPSGDVESGVAGSFAFGSCVSPCPSPLPSVTIEPTALPSLSMTPTSPCEIFTVELFDSYGDG